MLPFVFFLEKVNFFLFLCSLPYTHKVRAAAIVNKHSFTFIFRDTCKELLFLEHVMLHCNEEVFRTGAALLAMAYQQGKSLSLVLAVGRQC